MALRDIKIVDKGKDGRVCLEQEALSDGSKTHSVLAHTGDGQAFRINCASRGYAVGLMVVLDSVFNTGIEAVDGAKRDDDSAALATEQIRENNRKAAKSLFVHYMKLIFEWCGQDVDTDNIAEWEHFVDCIIKASTGEGMLK